ncbi:unnamed protein product [Litomosoides sigmodontis]|uniref:Uncharacterized protein n=1 Tax=Litomosoides sigmodontis TaxID=42156 RepID=A0A3P6T0B1_LITSI|nr:unnamed protein product [Litomosoides sigmodontis]
MIRYLASWIGQHRTHFRDFFDKFRRLLLCRSVSLDDDSSDDLISGTGILAADRLSEAIPILFANLMGEKYWSLIRQRQTVYRIKQN